MEAVSEIAEVYSGGTPNRSRPELFGGEIPWVKSGELNRRFVLAAEETLTEEGLASCSARWARSGSVLVAMYGATAGAVAWLGIDAAINQAIAAISTRDDSTDPAYLFLALEHAVPRLLRNVQGSGQPNLNAGMIKDLELRLPPQGEQRRIAGLNSMLQRQEAAVAMVLRAKVRLKRGLMRELLTAKRRLKGFDGKPWAVHRLGDLFDERVESGRADLPLLSITADRGVIPRDEVDRKDTSNADKSKYLRIAPGDIGYNTMRMWQGVSALSAYEGIVSPAYTICVPKPSVHPEFAAYLFKLPAVIDLFRRHSQGLVNDTLNLKYPYFARIEVSFPDLKEQQAVAEVLQALDCEIDVLERQGDALERQRRGVAELLLTGKVRIPG